MSIKLRIILGFFLTILLMASGGIFFAGMQMRDDADSEFAQSSGRQLNLLDDYLENFLRTAQINASLVASMADLTELADSMPNFSAATKDSEYTSAVTSPEVRAALVPLQNINSKNVDYLEVYVGYPNGAYATGLAEMKVPAGFDTSKRPWYAATAASAQDGLLSEAYVSLTGDIVFAVTQKMKGADNKLAGIVGIDVSLKSFSAMLTGLKFGQTGHFLVLEGTGRVLCDPITPGNVGKLLGKELTTFLQTSALFSGDWGATRHKILVGVDYRTSGNLGEGKIFDPFNPPYRSLSEDFATQRERAFKDVPFMHHLEPM